MTTTTPRTTWQRLLLLAAAAIAAATVSASRAAVSSSEICASAEFQALTPTTLASSPVTVKSLIKGDQVCLEFALTSTVASSAAWFAVGLSTANSMVSSPSKSVMLFQSSVGSPESYVLGGYTRSQVSKGSDQTAFVLGSASASTMKFSYQRTLAAASSTEVAIAASTRANFIWAYGSSWPISSHRSGTMGSATYTFGSADGTATANTPIAGSSSSTSSQPFCKDKNCTAIVGGATFLIMLLAGLLVTSALRSSPVGRVLLQRTLTAPPVKATTNRAVASPLTLARQAFADLRIGEVFIVFMFAAAVVTLVVILTDETKTVVSGQVVLLTLMFVMLPVSRVPLWSIFFSSSFERIVKFHRWIGMALTVAVIVHLVLALKLTSVTQSEKYGEVVPLYGFIAFVAFVTMALLANEVVRRVAFEVFYISHRVLSVVGLVFAVLHTPKIIGVALTVPIAFYVIGMAVHWVTAYTSAYQASVSVHHASDVTSLLLQTSAKTSKWAQQLRPGAYFWVKIPTISHTQWHPFSAIVTPNGDSIGFCIKALGNKSYTRALLDEAQKMHAVSVNLSGPVGKLSLDVDEYDAVVLVAGGIGITPMLSMINQKRLFPSKASQASAKSPDWFVVWSVHEASHLLTVEDFMPSQAQLDYAATTRASIQDPNQPLAETGSVAARRPLNVNWSMHVSRAQSDGTVTRENGDVLAYRAGRPVLDEFVNSSRFPNRHVAVLACGPPTLVVEAQALARECGFDFHKEVFHW